MITRMLGHMRRNTVAYLALVFSAVGGGGGYAVAATTHHGSAKKTKKTAIVACASKKTGELFLHTHGKCAKGRKKVTWAVKGPRGARGAAGKTGAAGAPAPSIFAAVDTELAINGIQTPYEKGLIVTRSGVGAYTATVTDSVCSEGTNVPTVSPMSRYALGLAIPPSGVTPVAYVDQPTGAQFTIHVGYVGDTGAFVPLDYFFDVQDTCYPASTTPGGR